MSSIDNRIVNMEFDNAQFEAGVAQSISSLNNLEKSLQLKDVATGIQELSKTVNSFDISGIASNVNSIADRFSTLGVVGMSVINRLTNGFLNFGMQTASNLFLKPIISGFNELELQNKSIQTILANTSQRYGTTIDDVRKSLDELNVYADKTIYNFSQMTDNIGKFTAAGVDLESSVNAIRGMSNLGAFMGAEANQVSGAMYQMSQAMATGVVQLLDWRSMELRGLAGTEFKDDILRTARARGAIYGEQANLTIDELISANGGFRESLKEKWLTNDIFLESLSHFATDVAEINQEAYKAQLLGSGYTEDDVKAIMYLSETANKAATEVRSWSQLWDTLAEEAGSSWTQTWDLIFGGYEKGKALFNGAYQMMKPFVEGVGNLRNFIVQDLVHTGSIEALFKTVENVGKIALDISKAFGDSFSRTFGLQEVQNFLDTGTWSDASHIGKVVSRIAWAFEDFTNSLQLSGEDIQNFRDIFDGLNSVLVFALDALSLGITSALEIGKAFSPVLDIVLRVGAEIGKAITYLKDVWLDLAITDDLIGFVKDVLYPIQEGMKLFSDFIGGLFDIVDSIFGSIFPQAGKAGSVFYELGKGLDGFFKVFHEISQGTKPVFDFLRDIGKGLTTNIIDGAKGAIDWIKNLGSNSDSVFGRIANKVKEVAGNIGDTFNKSKVGQDWGASFTGLNNTIENEFKKTPVTLTSIFNVCKEAVKGFFTFLSTEFQNVFPKLSETISNFFKELPNRMSAFFGKVKDMFKANNGEFSFAGFIDTIRDKISSFIDFLKDKRLTFTEKFTDFFGGAYEKLKDLGSKLSGGLNSFLDMLGGALGVEDIQAKTSAFDKIGAILSASVGRLKDMIAPVTEDLGSLATDFSKGLGQFIDTMFGSVGELDIPWQDIAIVATLLSATKAFNSISGAIKAVKSKTGPLATLQEVGGSIKGAFDQLKTLETTIGKDFKWFAIGTFVKSLPPLIAAIAGLAGVAAINPDAVNQSLGAVMLVMGSLFAIMEFASSRFSMDGGKISLLDSINFASLTAPIIAMAGAIAIISAALAGLSGINVGKLENGLWAIGKIWSMLLGTMAATSMYGQTKLGKNTLLEYNPQMATTGKSMAVMLLGMAAAIKIVAGAVKQIGKMEPDDIVEGISAISIIWGELTAAVIGVTAVSGHFGGRGLGGMNFGGTLAAFLGLAAAVRLIAGPVKEFSNMDLGSLIQGVAGIGALFLAIGESMNIATKNLPKGGNFLGLTGFVLALSPLMLCIKELGNLDFGQAVTGLGTFAGALTILGIAASKLGPMASQLSGLGTAILKFAAAAALVGIAAAGIGSLITVLGSLENAIPDQGNWVDNFTNVIKGVCEAIVGSADAIGKALLEVIISSLNNIADATPRITEALARVFMAACQNLQMYIPDMVNALMDVIRTLFQSFGAEISGSDFGADLASSIIETILGFVAGIAIFKGAGATWGDVAKMIVGINGILIPLAICGSLLQSTANEFSAGSIAALDVMFGEIGAFVLAVNGLHLQFDPSLFATMGGFAAVIDEVVAIIGVGGTAILGAVGALGGVAGAETLKQGVECFKLVGEAIGGFFGGIGGGVVGGYQSAQSDFLPHMADNLDEFTKNASGFIEYFKTVDDSYVERMTNFGNAVGDMITSITSIPPGQMYDAKLTQFGKVMGSLGDESKEFGEKVKDIDADKIKTIADTIDLINKIAKDLPEAPLTNYKTINEGRKQSLGEFAKDVASLFTTIKDSMGDLNGIENFDFTRMEDMKNFVLGMIDLANQLPEAASAARLAWGGKQTLGEFGRNIGSTYKELFAVMQMFNDPVAFNGQPLTYGLDRLNEVRDFIKSLAEMDMPEAPSVVGWLFGGNRMSIADFAADMRTVSHTLFDVDWSWLNTFPGTDLGMTTKLQNFEEFISTLGTVAQNVGNTLQSVQGAAVYAGPLGIAGGFFYQDFQTLGDFARELSANADNFKTFFNNVSGWDMPPAAQAKVTNVCNAIKTLADAQYQISQAAYLNVAGGSNDVALMNLAQFSGMLANGVLDTEGNKVGFVDSLKQISDQMTNFDAPNLDKLGSLSGAVKNLAEGYKALNEVTFPESVGGEGVEPSDNVGKITAMVQDVQTAVPGLKDLATAFDDMDDEGGIPSIEKMSSAVGVIRDLAGIYKDVIDPFIEETDSDTEFLGGKSTVHGKHLNYDKTIQPLTDFANQLPALARGLRNFQNNLKGFTVGDTTVDAFDPAAIEQPIAMLERFRDFGNTLKDVDWGNEGNIHGFSDRIPSMGLALRDFANNVKGFQQDFGIYDVWAAVEAGKKIAELGNVAKDWDATSVTKMWGQLGNLGTGLKSLHDAIGPDFDAERMKNAMPGIQAVVDGFNDIKINDDTADKVTKIQGFIENIVSAFGGGTAQDKYNKQVGQSLTEGMGVKFGDTATFAEQMQEMATNMSLFATGLSSLNTAIEGIPEISLDEGGKVSNFSKAIGEIIDAFNFETTVEQVDGTRGVIMGSLGSMVSNINLFASAISSLGAAFRSFQGDGTDVADGGAGAIDSIKQVKELITTLQEADLPSITTDMGTLSEAIRTLVGGSGAVGAVGMAPGAGQGVESTAGQLQQVIDLITLLGSTDVATPAGAIQQMATALSTLSGSGAEAGGAMGGGIQPIRDFITELQGIDWSSATAGVSSFAASLTEVGSTVQAAGDVIVNAVTTMMSTVLQTLNSALPQFQSLGMSAGGHYANGISSRAGIAAAAAQHVASSAANAIRGATGQFEAAGHAAGAGFARGLIATASAAADAAIAIANKAAAAMRAALVIKSPSRVFMEIGELSAMGYAVGMSKGESNVRRSTVNVVANALADAYELAQNDMNLQPVIEPVVDMTNVDSSLGNLSTQFGLGGSTNLARSVAMAAAVSSRLRDSARIQNGEMADAAAGTVTNNFTQNITSPKAVSRMEVYRDTRNLFALEKGSAIREKEVRIR